MNVQDQFDLLWILVCCALVLVMQGGFLCVEAGLTRTKNSINVALKNIVDLGVSVALYWVLGYGLMFGATQAGIIGSSNFMHHFGDNAALDVSFIFQAMFCGAAVTIVAGAIAERIMFSGYIFLAVCIAGFIYPVCGHWIWCADEASGTSGWLAGLGFIDFAGSTAVHSVGGWAALAILIVIGPRSGRFSKDGTVNKINPSSLPIAMLGVILLWFGWIGFNGGSLMSFSSEVPKVISITCLGACGGLIGGVVVSRICEKHYEPLSIMNGTLAGLVGVTAGAHMFSGEVALSVGLISGVVAYFGEKFLLRLKIDDAVGAVPVHLLAGVWGTIAVAFFGDQGHFVDGYSRMDQFLVQLVGVLAIGITVFSSVLFVTYIYNKCFPLRVSFDDEYLGLNITEHRASSEISDLLGVMSRHANTGDITERAHIEPFTEVGQIASHYNGVIESLDKAYSKVRESEERLHTIASVSPVGIFLCDKTGMCSFTNRSFREMLGLHTVNDSWLTLIEETRRAQTEQSWLDAVQQGLPFTEEVCFVRDGMPVYTVMQSVSIVGEGDSVNYVGTITDVSDQKRVESQLAQAQKMESVGQLAAGVAHEINTPTQFIGDNIKFLEDSFQDLLDVQLKFTEFLGQLSGDVDIEVMKEQMKKELEDADVEYLSEELPRAIIESRDGVERIAEIVKGMKAFTHPGENELGPSDINAAIKSTIAISKNEWKYVADVCLDLDEDISDPVCNINEINQVVLNMVVNASHAIADNMPKDSDKGEIAISTRQKEGNIYIAISDTGSGMPKEICEKIFDPFFTTKEVGKGTGQGLAIAYKIIVKGHGGDISVASEVGKGTCFTIKLPLAAENLESNVD